MSKIYQLVFSLALLSSISLKSSAQCWNEVWSDEFSGTTLNTSNWSYELGTGCPSLCGWGNNEKEYYTNDAQNINVAGGNLNITARYNANYLGSGYNFTSAKINTRNKQTWKYGKFEARMKLPTGMGTWPAFWMLPQTSAYGGWPTSGEIDIMEYRGDLTTKVDGTLHYGNSSPNNRYDGSPYTLSSGDFVNSFHIFTVEWNDNSIRWYVDGILFKTETKTPNTLSPASNNAVTWPWDQNFYMIINLALGGWYAGNPSDFDVYGGNTSWTASLQVDYVKVYNDLSAGALTGNIDGKSSVIQSETNISYYIPATIGASYVWAVPSGASVVSGAGTNAITVNWGTLSGPVTVVKTVGCGSASYSLPVAVLPNKCGFMIEDFENIRIPTYGYINGQFTPKVSNPSSSIENTSPFCAQYIRNPSEQYDVIVAPTTLLGNADQIENGSKRFMMDVYSDGSGRVIELTLENNTVATAINYPSGRHSTYTATTTKVNEWETLTFTYKNSPDGPLAGAGVNQMVLLIMPNTYTGNTFYLDNLLLNETPPTPTITGVSTVCTNQTGVPFSANLIAGFTYNWSVPSGATITSGQTTNAIVVDFAAAGNVSVIPSNASGCASPTATDKTITTTPAPTNPAITGLATVCNNATSVAYSIPTQSGVTYTWTVPSDATIASGQSTSAISVNYGLNSGSVGIVTSKSNNCPGTTSSKIITNSNCTSSIDELANQVFQLYPNPAAELLTIRMGDKFTSSSIKIAIFNANGRMVYANEVEAANDYSVALEDFSTGLYLVQISDKTNSYSKNFIKK